MHDASAVERFWRYVDKTDGCWNWTGGHYASGYACFGGRTYAHRFSYEINVGAIPPGRHVDHRCHNKGCVNPEHLRLATHKQNAENLRGPLASNTTGFAGVCHYKRTGRFLAYVTHNGRRRYLGYHPTAEAAGEVARKARCELFTHNDLDREAS